MRLTVGPLPPAVYWRRRAVVLGVALLFLIVVLYSCTGSGSGNSGDGSSPSPSATPTGEPATTGGILTPESGEPATEEPTGPIVPVDPTGPTEPAVVPAAPGPADGSCTDEEMLVTPVPSQTTVKQGATVQLRLRIRNVSQRTCSRDVGADLQELYISLGAEKIWSSDICGAAKGSNVQSFGPSIEHEYQVAWNGRDSSRCEGGVASGPYPEPGEYQLFARLGSRLSDPVKITITR